jgi:ABC-type amino acid transport substrate-binding protein
MRGANRHQPFAPGGPIVIVMRALAAVAAAGLAAAASADSFDINVNSDAVEARYATNFRSAEFTVGGLYNGDEDAWLASTGLLAIGERSTKDSRSEAGLGGRIYGGSVDNQDLLALALGGQFRWFPGNGPFGVGAYGYIAPDVVTGIDAKLFWEAGARVEYEVVKNTAGVYLGYRRARAEFKDDTNRDLDKGGHIGLHISF